MIADRLARAWDARPASADSALRFTHAGLVLGAGTVLAAAGASGRPSGQWTSGDAGGAPANDAAAAPPAASSGRSQSTEPPARPAPSPTLPSGSSIGPHSEVNPSTVTPAAGQGFVPGFPYRGENACWVAMDQCEDHAIFYDASGDAANDNGPNLKHRLKQCYGRSDVCLDIQAEVEHRPKVIAGVAHFPDGGVVAFIKGEEPVYLPPGWKGRAIPIWRGG